MWYVLETVMVRCDAMKLPSEGSIQLGSGAHGLSARPPASRLSPSRSWGSRVVARRGQWRGGPGTGGQAGASEIT